MEKKTSIFRDQTGKYSFNKFISFIAMFILLIPATFINLITIKTAIMKDKTIDSNAMIAMIVIYFIVVLLVVAPAAIKGFIEKTQLKQIIK